jgi:hypothetical protein
VIVADTPQQQAFAKGKRGVEANSTGRCVGKRAGRQRPKNTTSEYNVVQFFCRIGFRPLGCYLFKVFDYDGKKVGLPRNSY